MDLYGSLADIPHHHPFVAALNAVTSPLESGSSQSLFDDIVGRDELAKDWARAERVLELIASEMRVRRNAVLSVTSRLPPEVLSLVFSHCIDADPPRASLPEGVVEDFHSNQDIADYDEGTLRWDVQSNGQLGWIRLTHVCCSWRTLLCSTSKAWADCLGILPAAIEDTLYRAGSRLPLTFQAIATVAGAGSARSLTDIFSLYSLAGSRIAPSRFRAIYILDLRARPLLAEHSNIDPEHGFDNLEHLEVIRVYGDHVSKAPAFLRAPKLQSLKLMHCMLDSSSINLAHLSLNCLGSRGLSLDSLMRLLHRMCNTLRTLELIYVIEHDTEETVALDKGSSFLPLPSLESLRLEDNDDNMSSCLQRLTLPATVRQRLDFYMEPDAEDDWAITMAPAFRCALTTIQDQPTPDGVSIGCRRSDMNDYGEYTGFIMHLYCDSARFQMSNAVLDTDTPKLSFTASSNSSSPQLPLILQDFCRLGNTSLAHFVSLDLPPWPGEDIKDVMSHFPGVRMLRIVNPLHTRTPEVILDSKLVLPFIPLNTTSTSDPSPYALDILWLVQDAKTKKTFKGWCEELSSRLRAALLARMRVQQSESIQPVKVLRVQSVIWSDRESEYGSPAQILETSFFGLAEEIQLVTR